MTAQKRVAFKQIFDENSEKIFKLCLGYAGDVEAASDLMQETFIKVWQHLDKFRNQSQLSTWIYRIAVNTCLSYLRTAGRNVLEPLNERILEHHAEEPSEKAEQLSILHRAIAGLNEYDRLIITMVLEEVPYGEIAEIAGISEGNLRVRIHRIKQKLTAIYNKLAQS